MALENDKFDKFLDLLKLGHTRRDACRLSGIAWTTVKGWVRGDDEYSARMRAHMEASESGIVHTALTQINKAAEGGQWKAAQWLLETKRPKDYGPKGNTATPVLPGRVIDVTPSLPDGVAKEKLFLLAMRLCDEDPVYRRRLLEWIAPTITSPQLETTSHMLLEPGSIPIEVLPSSEGWSPTPTSPG